MEATKRCPFCAEEIQAVAVKCKHCGSDLTTAVPPPGVRRGVWIALLSVTGGTLLLALAAHQFADKPAQAAANVAVPSSSAAPVDTTPDIPDLTSAEAASAFSDFIGERMAKLMAMSAMMQVYSAKMQQENQFRDLAAMRKDSEELKGLLMQDAEQIQLHMPGPFNISDSDADVFTALAEAGDQISNDWVSLAVNFAVSANYGMSDSHDDAQIMRDIKQHRDEFTKAAVAGYKHFGIAQNAINLKTLTLKSVVAKTP